MTQIGDTIYAACNQGDTIDTSPLTKENFFNNLMIDYPNAMGQFCDFIDEYKKEVDWVSIIPTAKFHDMPYAIQMGIWFEFVTRRGGCVYEIEDMFSYDLRADITGMIQMIETEYD